MPIRRGRTSLRDTLRSQAKAMRRNPTLAEAALWSALRNQKRGSQFRQQVPIDRHIADFYCPEARLIIEVDGGVHEARAERDAVRQTHLERLGITVLRFDNAEVMGSLSKVLQRIDKEVLTSKQRLSATNEHLGPLLSKRNLERWSR